MKDRTQILFQLVFSRISPFLNLEIDQNERYYLNSSKTALNRISWNIVVMKDIMCRYAFLQDLF